MGVGIIPTPPSAKCAPQLRHALQTVGVGGRSVVSSAREFPCDIGAGQSQLLGRMYLAKDAPRRVVQAEGILYFAEGLSSIIAQLC